MIPFPPDRVAAAVDRACREHQLDTRWASSVYAYLEEDEGDWPGCCQSACEPCVLTLASAARRALILLESEAR